MLRTNLSTRPFYNERVVHLLLGIAALLVALLTAYNVIRVVTLSRQNTELSALIAHDRREAQRLTGEAQKIRAGIDQAELQATAAAAQGANRLIDQRTFSWTEFFNRIEDTLPPDVMLTSVQPSFSGRVPVVQMLALGRRAEDIDEFMGNLEATRAFTNVLIVQEDRTDQGLHRVTLRTVYTATPGVFPGGTEVQPDPDPEPAPGDADAPVEPMEEPAPDEAPPDPGDAGPPPRDGRGRGRGGLAP